MAYSDAERMGAGRSGVNHRRRDLTPAKSNARQLETCTSIEAKRLFLYRAERAERQFVDGLDRSRVDLGKGKRAMTETGSLTLKSDLLAPEETVDTVYCTLS